MGSLGVSKVDGVVLPVLDISSGADSKSAQALLDAAVKYGFLYISPAGTTLTESLVDSVFEISKKFFTTASLAEKQQCAINTENRGWFGLHNESLDPSNHKRGDFKEGFNIGRFPDENLDSQPDQTLPPLFKQNLATLHKFEIACRDTIHKILNTLGAALELDHADGAEFFSKRHPTKSASIVRMLHYPSVDGTDYEDEVDIRAGAHTDYGSLTLLFQRPGQPGLQIQAGVEDGESGKWTPVPVFPAGYTASSTLPPIVVNIGDLFSYWTNGLLRSTVHRVVFPKDGPAEDRYSITYFGQPGDDVELTPIPSQLVSGRNSVGIDGKPIELGVGGGLEGNRSLTAKEHLAKRLAATYSERQKV